MLVPEKNRKHAVHKLLRHLTQLCSLRAARAKSCRWLLKGFTTVALGIWKSLKKLWTVGISYVDLKSTLGSEFYVEFGRRKG